MTALIFLALVESSPAATITLTPSKDATIFGASVNQGLPNTVGQDLYNHSNGAGPGIFSGGNGTLAPHRALLAFDVAGQIPAGSVITGAQLTLHIGIVAGSGGAPGLGDPNSRVMDLFRLTTDWGEGSTGANATNIGGTGQGFPANPGDATWNAAAYNLTPWTTPGGDYDPTVKSSLAVGRDFYAAQTWGSTPGLVEDVQGWLDQPSTNFGWILINQDETLRQTHRAFYSREWSDPSLRPQLQITYESAPVPVPPALWLFGTAIATLAGFAGAGSRSGKGAR
ncbi:DNRLRE domain-containing protein [Methylococcus sp. EFPC2]|uniref:DNRLRE domain-containing protein n=1 Tax=Methylococcus sp. EFPC2 TaxID=2812648 RepID=UPI0019687390|nr:DNRLRE domain-containing protein [Methylococcus sp. EFPC2]QSA95751.1 DNRLRE domain-containing protein [Methylococcus sp. EFPC2]